MADNPYLALVPQTSENPYLHLVPTTKSDTTQHPGGNAKPSFETPKAVRTNPLRTIAEYLTAPVSIAGAAWESVPFLNSKEHQPGNYVADAWNTYLHQGPAALNQKYGIASDATFQREGRDPKKADPYMRGIAELGANWFSPGNEAVGAASKFYLGALAKGAKAARAASPAIDAAATTAEKAHGRAVQHVSQAASKAANTVATHLPGSIGAGIRGLVDRYSAAGLPQRGGIPYVTAAFAAQAAPEHAAAQATNRLRALADGLTTAQKRELQKLSYVDENGERFATRDANVPEPAKGPSLEDRAGQIRGILFDLDRRQEALGIRTRTKQVMPRGANPNPNAKPRIKSGDLSDSGTYWPMRQFGKQPVFQSQELAQAAQSGDELALSNVTRKYGRNRSAFASTVSKTGHKTERDLPDILNPDVEADLHPEYDPIYQLERHIGETERAIANEQSRRGLETLPNINPETGAQRTAQVPGLGETPLYARMPVNYYLEANARRPLAMIFGQGEEGRAGMDKYIGRMARAKAQDLARQDPRVLDLAQQAGVDPNSLGRSLRGANLAPLKGRMAEAASAQRATGRLAKNIAGIAQRSKSEFGNRAQDLTMQSEQLERERAAAASIPKIPIKPGMDEGAQAAAEARNSARAKALNPLPIGKADAAAEEATRAAQSAAVGFDKVAAHAAGFDAKQTARVKQLSNEFERRAAKATTAAAFQKAVNHYYAQAFDEVSQRIRTEAPKVPEGYSKESTLGLGSPTGREMALDDAFANFFKGGEKISPKEVEDARKLWHTLEVLNRLARTSVVLIPTVHGINNLGMAFLAEGGDPARMAEIMSGRAKFDEALKQRAYTAGAATDWSQQTFGLDEGAHSTTAIPERAAMIGKKAGPLSRVVEPAANVGLRAERVYNRMNHWLFHDVEQGYAFDLFDRFTKQGMSDGEAAIRVRNALGRYDNISPRERMLGLNRVFYFYPWMKTVVSFWTKKGLFDPKWWEAPTRAIQVNNEAQGYDDPSKPFTATFGKRSDGEWRRYIIPAPQRVLENVAEAARIPSDVVKGDWSGATQDVKSPLNWILGHFNPALQMGKDLYDVATQGEQKAAPWNTFKVQPGQTGAQQNAQIAGNILSRLIAPISRVGSIAQDPVAGIAAYLTGSTTYGTKSQTQVAQEKDIRLTADGMFHDAIAAAKHKGDDATVQKLTALREAAIQRAIANLAARANGAPQAAANAAPATASNPYMNP